MNLVIATITKINLLFLVVVLVSGIFAALSLSSFIIGKVQAQNAESETKRGEEKCISYNKSEKLISITCKYADFADVTRLINFSDLL